MPTSVRLQRPRAAPLDLSAANLITHSRAAQRDRRATLEFAVAATGWTLSGEEPARVWETEGDVLVSWLRDPPPLLAADLGQAPVIRARHVGYDDMLRQAGAQVDASVVCSWHTLTPTVFRRRGRYFPAPDLTLLVASLAARWNENCEPHQLVDPAAIAVVARDATVLEIDGRTVTVGFDRSTDADADSAGSVEHPAFMGHVDFVLRGSGMAQAVAVLLAASLLGIGEETRQGLGAAEIEVHPHRRDRTRAKARQPRRSDEDKRGGQAVAPRARRSDASDS